jgi:hypothetical protein
MGWILLAVLDEIGIGNGVEEVVVDGVVDV